MPHPLPNPKRSLRNLSITVFLLLLLVSPAAAQTWYTPGQNSYPSVIDGFTNGYGYNDQGDLFNSMSSYDVWENRWWLSRRGSLSGLNHIENRLGCAVGDNGALWRIDSKSKDYYILSPKVTNADLLSICRYNYYNAPDRYFAVGKRGTVIKYYPELDSTVILTQDGHPDLYAIEEIDGDDFCAVGDSGCILVSTDYGSSWSRKDRNQLHQYRCITRWGSIVLLSGQDAGTGEALFIRTDPQFKVWIEHRFPGHRMASGIRCGAGSWFVFGDLGLMARSIDSAHTWQSSIHGTRINFSDIMVSGWNITAVGKSPVDSHFRSIISDDSGKTWKGWFEPEDSLGAFAIPRKSSSGCPFVTERGYVFNLEYSSEYPRTALLSVPFALLSCAVINYRTWVIGGANGHILLTEDDGKNWRSTEALSADVVTLETFRRDSLIALTRDSRIYRSADRGNSWHLAYVAPPGQTLTRIQCESGDTCLAIGREGPAGAAWISFDGGYHWNSVLRYVDEITGIDVDSAGVIYLSTVDGILLRTSDNGAHWTVPLIRHGSRFTDISVGSRTRISLIEGRDCILTSKDAGITWSEQRFKGQIFDRLEAWSGAVLAWGGYNTILSYGDYWTLTDRLGSLRETIHAAVSDTAWKVISVGENGMILLNNWSYNHNWDRKRIVSPVSDNLNGIAHWNSSDLLAVGDSGVILKSTQPGLKWEIMYRDPGRRKLTQVVSFPSGLAIAAGPDILLRTTPDGSGWIEESRYPGGFLAAPAQRGWYTANSDGSIYFSEDDGRSWGYRSTLPQPVRECGAFDAENLYVLCVDTTDGARCSILYRSADYANTWVEVFRMPGDFSVLRLFDGSRVMLVGEEGTVFVSDNYGRSWFKTRSRFRTTFREIVPVRMRYSTTTEYLFLANLREMDLLILKNPVLALSEPSAMPSRIFIADVYPNPAAAILNVRIAGDIARTCHLSLRSVLGQEMWAEDFTTHPEVPRLETIDISRFARGMYFLMLSGVGRNESRLVHLR